jgi:DNA polymerase IV
VCTQSFHTMSFRKIIHIDMDAFFASVEQRDHPELRGKAIAVGGGGKRGVVAAASYEARKFGVHSAMPGSVAARLCPQLIFVKSNFEEYKKVSMQIRTIFAEYTDLIEPLSLDEAYLDVTENKMGIASATQIAQEIREKIFQQTELTASAGVSFTKFIAKTASGFNKPNGITVIKPDQAQAFLDKLPIEKFHGIGKVTADKMRKLGIRNGADLYKWAEIDLVRRFGKAGLHYFKICRGQDDSPVNPRRVRKSISAEETFFDDIADHDAMKEELIPIAKKVFEFMKLNNNFGRTLILKAKTPDFQIITRSRTYFYELQDFDELLRGVFELLDANKDVIQKVRLLGVGISNLNNENVTEGIQLEFDFVEEP